VLAILVVFAAIVLLVSVANRIGVAYPIVLVLGGILDDDIQDVPT